MNFYIKAPYLDLEQTLFCGQCFRFKQENGIFTGVAGNRQIEFSQLPDGIMLINADEKDVPYWENYFDVGLDYDEVFCELSADEAFRRAFCGGGIRILRQEPFETLISFIISQNNNIKRISGIVERLCEGFGEKIGGGAHAFPTAERLSALSEDELAPIRAGFRAKYILDAAKKVYSGEIDLEKLRFCGDDEAREELKKIKGVGDKVADCVLLFGLHKLGAVPKDVWVKRILAAYYPDGLPDCMKRYGGIAQQYLFDYARKNGID